MIPFTTQIPIEERVPQSEIIRKIQNEFSGILNWILEGYRFYKLEGLNEPISVSSSTEEYFENSDVVGKFLEEECELLSFLETKVQLLYDVFTIFMKQIGEHHWTRNAFNEELTRRGFKKKKKGSRGYQWLGIGLKNPNNPEPLVNNAPDPDKDDDMNFPD